MLGTQFYPTPKSLLAKMLKPYYVEIDGRCYLSKSKTDLDGTNRGDINLVLEPSAGKGDLLEPSAGKGDLLEPFERTTTHVCETDFDLQMILHQKGHKIVGEDFLKYHPDVKYDLIIMNPPFAHGCEHLLHAWEIADNTDVICILNAETLRNPYTKKRKLLLEIIDANGSFEYLEDEFVEGERKTNVEIALIRLFKREKRESFEFDVESHDFSFEKVEETGLATIKNKIDNIIEVNEDVKKAIKPFIKEAKRFQAMLDNAYGRPDVKMSTIINSLSQPTEAINDFCQSVNRATWKELLTSDLEMYKYITSSVNGKIERFIDMRQNMRITKEFLQQVIEMLYLNKEQYMKEGLDDVFETFTAFDAKNKLHFEGWKTNSAYKVNKRVILPYMPSGWDGRINLDYSNTYVTRALNDIDKVLSYYSGHRFDEIDTIVSQLQGEYKGQTHESTFFKIRTFKKGTVHLTFKDLSLLERFNILGASGKNWLPESDYKAEHKENQEIINNLKQLN